MMSIAFIIAASFFGSSTAFLPFFRTRQLPKHPYLLPFTHMRQQESDKASQRRLPRRATSGTRKTSNGIRLESVDLIAAKELNTSPREGSHSNSMSPPQALSVNENDNQALSALKRAVEIGTVLGGQVMAPILTSLSDWPTEDNGGWEEFWSTKTDTLDANVGAGGIDGISRASMTHAQRLSMALEQLGPTYVKFGQALGSRPDVVPPSLAAALSLLQDDMTPFDSDVAKEIIFSELRGREEGFGRERVSRNDLEAFVSSLTTMPVAAASIGQVYRGRLPGKGDVAVKVQRPGVRRLVERDTELLLSVATFLESIPAVPSLFARNQTTRLINTQLVAATQEFMSRIFEELDYRNEAKNCIKFADLYSEQHGTSKEVSVVVPQVYLPWCTENVLVMEWIDGTKLTDVQSNRTNETGTALTEEDAVKENLALVKAAIDSTLSQLLVTGVLHADPHAGNLLKMLRDDGTITLGYLDFGLLSTIPGQVRDALICACALQVFERDVDAVASLFGELRLIPQHVLDDEAERAALATALQITFENSLLYPDTAETAAADNEVTAIPELKFDKLLDSLARLVPRFQFDLPPYFINNARALSTLEGIAKSLDPSFNVLTIMYPYALNRLLQNPTKSSVVEKTLQSLIRSCDGNIDRRKIRRLLRDSALISGVSKRRVMWDIVKTKPGRKLTGGIVREELGTSFAGRRRQNRVQNNNGKRRERKKKWFYLEL